MHSPQLRRQRHRMAAEEFIAELGAAFLCANLSITSPQKCAPITRNTW
jgi:hypothetical protein